MLTEKSLRIKSFFGKIITILYLRNDDISLQDGFLNVLKDVEFIKHTDDINVEISLK